MPATISVGSTGDDVKRLQRVLARQLLWNPFGPITGVFDATLETSVKTFQQSNGLAGRRRRRPGDLGEAAGLPRGVADPRVRLRWDRPSPGSSRRSPARSSR